MGYPVKASTTIYQGALVVLNAGYAVGATAAVGLIPIGRAKATVINASVTDGAYTVEVEPGIFLFANSTAGDAVAQANVGAKVYLVDDQTVALTSGYGARSIAGVAVAVETAGVWVAVGCELPCSSVPDTYGKGTTETVTSGAVSVSVPVTNISVTGTQAYTLASGTFKGQIKYCRCTVASTNPVGTLTPAAPTGFATIVFDKVGDDAVLRWNASAWELIGGTAADVYSQGATETVTSGAVSIAVPVTNVSVTGTQAFTLADGTFKGQLKYLRCSVAATTPVGTLTPTSPTGFSTLIFDKVGDDALLRWSGAAWELLGGRASDTYDQGTTETVTSAAVSPSVPLTNISTTGTVAYTLADGSFKGQLKYLRCTVAASTPQGTLTPATPTGFATAYFDAVGEAVILRWTGAAWEVAFSSGATIS
jgi:hypothetical protein